ncbi:SLC13 family permease [Desulfitobacterium hafniense]|uniref:SLC13 family permease n=1 Tax=Desulfitobacterium hafniense TaxID=49338 RepID=UPI000379E3F2|nr:DASS family sodium-coupled anion symporter [Desulfitobacterium hafniense]
MSINSPVVPSRPYVFNKRNALIFFAAIAVMLIIYLLPSPPSFYKGTEEIPLTFEGKAVFAVLVYAVILWLTEAIPFPITALSMIIILHLMGVSTFTALVKTGLGSSVLFFLMGAMGLSAAITVSGLANRIMLGVLSKVGTRTDRIVFTFMALGTFLSMWVTDMAVAAMLLPLGVNILRQSGCKPLQSNFGRCLMIGIVYGALIGGTSTPSGCGANILAISYLRELTEADASFLQWMIVGVPGALMMLPAGWFLLMKVFPPEIKNVPIELDDVRHQNKELGPLTRQERNTTIVFFTAVTMWLGAPLIKSLTGISIPEDFTALFAFLLLFLPGLQVFGSWKEANEHIDWSGLMLIAGGIAAGMLLAETGTARYIAWGALNGIGALHPMLRVAAVLVLVEALKIFFSSNSVTGAVVIPLVIALALDLGMNPWIVAGPAGIATSMAFIMVTSSPTNVIPYSSGYFSIKDFAKCGVLMTVIGIVAVTLSVAIFGRFAGMNIWL